ncbi:tRNA/rRNA methyltransferase, partial [Salmonella enterica subsp. enterica serovar Kentucky]|nr:tRNA/rRNA methyltransferase [Salmonella enterica subsp. enterica serovar Kentucky]
HDVDFTVATTARSRAKFHYYASPAELVPLLQEKSHWMRHAALATILVMGIFAFGNVPGLQVYVVQKAEQFTPNAVDVASGL